MLLVQAAAFWAPCALWSLLCDRSAIPISSLLKTSHWAALGDDASREKNVAFSARLFFDGLLRTRPRRALGCQAAGGAPMLKGRVSMLACLASGGLSLCAGNYLALAYLGLKLVWIAHAGAQLYFIQYFIGTNYTCECLVANVFSVQCPAFNVQCSCICRLYGVEFVRDALNGSVWHHSGIFPRVTWCDFEIGKLGGPYKYSVQCGAQCWPTILLSAHCPVPPPPFARAYTCLPIEYSTVVNSHTRAVLPNNMLNEKIYLFLWFWLVGICVASAFSLAHWALRLGLPCNRRRFVLQYLKYYPSLFFPFLPSPPLHTVSLALSRARWRPFWLASTLVHVHLCLPTSRGSSLPSMSSL